MFRANLDIKMSEYFTKSFSSPKPLVLLIRILVKLVNYFLPNHKSYLAFINKGSPTDLVK